MRWLPYVYQYGIMWVFLIAGIVAGIKSEQLKLDTLHGKRYLVIMIGGLIGYMILQGFMQFIAPII